MVITASLIKDLRERTGAGMMDCKKVLVETNGDIDIAIEELRKRGAAAAEKKAGRIAAEGVIVTASDARSSVLVEVNCETDFVAKDASFKAFTAAVAECILNHSPVNTEQLAITNLASGQSVEDTRQALIGKIGENISVRRFEQIQKEGGLVSHYIHGARIGVLVKLRGGNEQLGRDIAMHIAASRPVCIVEQDMDPALVEREKQIFIAQAEDSGKPVDIIEKMVAGRIKKFLKENTLFGQPFVKNPDQTVAQLLGAENAEVLMMSRLEVGEGIEKRNEDFVAEVMAQAGA